MSFTCVKMMLKLDHRLFRANEREEPRVNALQNINE